MAGKACPQCGRRTAEDQRFCGKCGYEFYAWEADQDSDQPISDARIGEYLVEDIQRVVEKRTDVYVEKFMKLEYGNPKRSFNWCAALFGANWTGYRLMVGETLLFIGLDLLLGFLIPIAVVLPGLLFRSPGLMVVVGIALLAADFVFHGYLGDWLYWEFVKRKLNRCGCRNRPAFDNSFKNFRMSEGSGASGWGVAAAILCTEIVKLFVAGLLNLL